MTKLPDDSAWMRVAQLQADAAAREAAQVPPEPAPCAVHGIERCTICVTPNAIAPSLQSYLGPILERWRIAKLEADSAAERAEALGREIKDACTAAGLSTTTLTDTAGRPVARYEQTTGWRLATTRLKTEHPEVYAAYATQSTTTRLVAVK